MNALRDFIRWRRVRHHVARHGWTFDFHGIPVTVPRMDSPGCANALLRGKYEAEEAILITRHLPPDRPVIELGGSIGVVSALIASRLSPDVAHVIIEANPALLDVCARNAAVSQRPLASVQHAAVAYGSPVARFSVGGNVHANHLARAGDTASVIEVQTVTLAALWHGIGAPDGFTLVCDIEGAEAEMIATDAAVLNHAGTVIMELHPSVYPDGPETERQIIATLQQAGLHLRHRLADVTLWTRD